MSKSPIEGRAPVAFDPTESGSSAGNWSDGNRRAAGAAAYYRLRSIALEARVKRLEAELERAENRLQETVTRYEQILQQRSGQDAVVTAPTAASGDGGASDD